MTKICELLKYDLGDGFDMGFDEIGDAMTQQGISEQQSFCLELTNGPEQACMGEPVPFQIETPPLRSASRDLLLSLHNPKVREALLIALIKPIEDDVLEWLAPLTAICWGFVELTTGRAGPLNRACLGHLAEMWDTGDVDQFAQVSYLESSMSEWKRSGWEGG